MEENIEKEVKNEENEVVEENKVEEKVENEVSFKDSLLSNLHFIVLLVLGVVCLIISIVKQFDTGISIVFISTVVGSSQLVTFLNKKNKINLICMILWYLVSLLGILQACLA